MSGLAVVHDEWTRDDQAPPRDDREVDQERVLLMGGPFHFRTCWVRKGAAEWYFPLPVEHSFLVSEYDKNDLPTVVDLKVARYYRAGAFGKPDSIDHPGGIYYGAIFDYGETK